MSLRDAAIRWAAGRLKPRLTRRRASLLTVLACGVSLPALAGEPSPQPLAEKTPPEVLAEFKIEKGVRPILVPVKFQDREYLFCLDTGATADMFDTSFKPLLGERIEVQEVHTLGGVVTSEFFNPPKAFVGELDLRIGGPVVCTDLEGLRRVLGRDIRGILGMGFLKNYVVRIDLDSGQLQFRRWDGRNHPEWGRTVYLQPGEMHDCPYVKARLPAVGEITLVVDSAYSEALGLVADVFGKATDPLAVAQGLIETGAGTHHNRAGRISQLALGGSEYRGLVAGEQNVNALGLGFLTRCVVTFDFPGMKLYLQPSSAFGPPDEIDMSGLHLWCVEARIVVHSVDPDSPAWTAGLRPEDVVLQIGERSASAPAIGDLRDLLKSGDGKEIKLTFKRGAEQKVVSFKLKKRI